MGNYHGTTSTGCSDSDQRAVKLLEKVRSVIPYRTGSWKSKWNEELVKWSREVRLEMIPRNLADKDQNAGTSFAYSLGAGTIWHFPSPPPVSMSTTTSTTATGIKFSIDQEGNLQHDFGRGMVSASDFPTHLLMLYHGSHRPTSQSSSSSTSSPSSILLGDDDINPLVSTKESEKSCLSGEVGIHCIPQRLWVGIINWLLIYLGCQVSSDYSAQLTALRLNPQHYNPKVFRHLAYDSFRPCGEAFERKVRQGKWIGTSINASIGACVDGKIPLAHLLPTCSTNSPNIRRCVL